MFKRSAADIKARQKARIRQYTGLSEQEFIGLETQSALHMQAARVYYPSELFLPLELTSNNDQTEGSLHRLISKCMAVDTAGNKNTQSLHSWGWNRIFFNATVTVNSPEFASAKTPKEILKSGFIARVSKVRVFATGGYGRDNKRKRLASGQEFDVVMASIPGIALDNFFTDQVLVGLDPIRNAQPSLAVLSNNVAVPLPSYLQAKQSLDAANADENDDYAYLQGSNRHYLVRTETGYQQSSNKENAVILNKRLYQNILAKRIELALTGICDQAADGDPPLLIKAVLLGGGFFAAYGWGDASALLGPTFWPEAHDPKSPHALLVNKLIIGAWKQALETFCRNHPILAQKIAKVEFPLFSVEAKTAYYDAWDMAEGDMSATQPSLRLPNGHAIEITQQKRDALVFTDAEKQQYTCAVINPADENAEPSNELDSTQSLEAELGANTNLALVQSHIFNSQLPQQTHAVNLGLAGMGWQALASVVNDDENDAVEFIFAQSKRGKLFYRFGFILGLAAIFAGIAAIIAELTLLFQPNLAGPLNFLPTSELLNTMLVSPSFIALAVIVLAAIVLWIVLLVLSAKESISDDDVDAADTVKSDFLSSNVGNFLSKLGIFVGFPLAAAILAAGASMAVFQFVAKPFMPAVAKLSSLSVEPALLLSVVVTAAIACLVTLALMFYIYWRVQKTAEIDFQLQACANGLDILVPAPTSKAAVLTIETNLEEQNPMPGEEGLIGSFSHTPTATQAVGGATGTEKDNDILISGESIDHIPL